MCLVRAGAQCVSTCVQHCSYNYTRTFLNQRSPISLRFVVDFKIFRVMITDHLNRFGSQVVRLRMAAKVPHRVHLMREPPKPRRHVELNSETHPQQQRQSSVLVIVRDLIVARVRIVGRRQQVAIVTMPRSHQLFLQLRLYPIV